MVGAGTHVDCGDSTGLQHTLGGRLAHVTGDTAAFAQTNATGSPNAGAWYTRGAMPVAVAPAQHGFRGDAEPPQRDLST